MSHQVIAAKTIDLQADRLTITAPLANGLSFASEVVDATIGSFGIGQNSLAALTTGKHDTAVGTDTGKLQTTGGENTYFGYSTGKSNITGVENTFIGSKAGYAATGSYSTLVGKECGLNVTTGLLTAVGQKAGQLITTQTGNTIFGYQAGKAVAANDETIVGDQAGGNITSGGLNTLLGSGCAPFLQTGASNILIGPTAGSTLVNGSDNVVVGKGNVSTGLSSGSRNILIGNGAGSTAPTTGNDCILIAHAGVASDSAFIRIGTASTHLKNFQAGIAGITTDVAAVACLVSSTGQLGVTSSNEDKKKDFKLLDTERVKEILHRTPVREFHYKEGHQAKNIGPNIEDMAPLLKDYYEDFVVKNEDGSDLGLATQNLPWLMLHDMQRMQREIDVLQNKESIVQDYDLKLKRARAEEEVLSNKKARL